MSRLRAASLAAIVGVLCAAGVAGASSRSSLRSRAHDDSLMPDSENKPLNPSISREEFEQCGDIASCDACVKQRGCGWCADSSSCVGGAPAGPVDLSGGRIEPDYAKCQNWAYSQCRSGSCEAKKGCNTCVSDVFCGWCGSTQQCLEGNTKGPVTGFCDLGWVRAPISKDTKSEHLQQSATSSPVLQRDIQQLCMANDLLTGQTIQTTVREQERRNATEAERIQKCDPCEGEWPNCDCGGNEEVAPPRPMSEDYVVRQVDEAVGVRPGSVNITYLNQLKERKRMSMSVDLRMEESKKAFESKEERLNRLLSMLPPAPTDKKVAELDKEDDDLVNGEGLSKAARNVTGDEMAGVVDRAVKNMDVDSARVAGDVTKRVAEMTAEVGGCDDCKEAIDKEADAEERAAEAAINGTASAAGNGTASAAGNGTASASEEDPNDGKDAKSNEPEGKGRKDKEGEDKEGEKANKKAEKEEAKPEKDKPEKAMPEKAMPEKAMPELGLPQKDVPTASVLPPSVPKGAAAIAERVETMKVEDKDGTSSPRAQLLRAGRKAKMKFAAETAKEVAEEEEKKVDEEEKEVEAEEEKVAKEQVVPDEEAEKLAEEENNLNADKMKRARAEAAADIAVVEADRNDAIGAADELQSAAQAFVAKEAQAVKKAKNSLESAKAAAARVKMLQEEEKGLAGKKFNKTSVVEEVRAKHAPKDLDSGVPCARRVLELVADSREEAVSDLTDLLEELKNKLSKADKEDAIRHHVGQLLQAKGEAEADVDASAQDLAAAIEGCIITEVE